MVNSDDFTKRIQKIMEHHDLNASSFAEKINVGRSSISHILSGRNKPSLDFVMNIVNHFPDVDLYWLLNGKGTYPKSESDRINPIKIITNSQPENTDTLQNTTISSAPDLFTEQKPINSGDSIQMKKGKNITKIIILYSDGSFKDYTPE